MALFVISLLAGGRGGLSLIRLLIQSKTAALRECAH